MNTPITAQFQVAPGLTLSSRVVVTSQTSGTLKLYVTARPPRPAAVSTK